MNRNLPILGAVLIAVSLLVGMGITLALQPATNAVAQTEEEGSLRTIEVSGQGQVEAEPDQATVRLGVQTEADTAGPALEENNERMTAVISATLEAGIEENDIQTEGFRLNPVYDNSPNAQRELTGYRASNIVRITVRDLTMLGELLDAVVEAGSNTIEGIRFEISNEAELAAAAREAAMQDAQQKAEQLTELADAELGPVHTILETGGARPLTASITEEASLAADVPIAAGTQTIQASVQVIWEIR